MDHLRAGGHEVIAGDVDLRGISRLLAIAATWAPNRFRWWVRYHLLGFPFLLRSRKAARLIRAHRDRIDVILQVGATFEPRGRGTIPYAIYCDSNARLAERGSAMGYSEVSALTAGERAGVVAREARVYRDAALIMTFSNRLRDSFVEDFHVPEGRVRTIAAGPNFPVDTVPPPSPEPRSGPPTVLFVGRRFHRKGGDLLLAAFRQVRSRIPGARLVVVGPPDLTIEEEGVTNLGFLSRDDPDQALRLRQAYSQAQVFCMPTRFEAFGLVYLEAMLFGLPCIGPDAWAVPEIVLHGETGLIVPPEDPDALARAIERILEDPELAARMGAAGRQRALAAFTWPMVVGRMVEGLRSIAPPPPD